MVEDLNFRKVKKYIVLIFFFLIFSTNLFSQDLKFQKLVKLDGPWGSSFINDNELIITEKSGKIKIIDINSQKISEPMLKNKALADGIAKAHPLKRLGEGKDSASLAKFLITEDSSWVTGQIIAVDGGRSKLS